MALMGLAYYDWKTFCALKLMRQSWIRLSQVASASRSMFPAHRVAQAYEDSSFYSYSTNSFSYDYPSINSNYTKSQTALIDPKQLPLSTTQTLRFTRMPVIRKAKYQPIVSALPQRDNRVSLLIIIVVIQMKSSKFSFSSSFNWQEGNLRALLHPIPFYIAKQNDVDEPFCHFTHKNLGTRSAPFRPQQFTLQLDDLTNLKYMVIDNYTHGSQMSISISDHQNGVITEVYRDQYICKGKTLKKEQKTVDIGALPCRVIHVKVKKGCSVSSKNITLVGIESSEIENKLGEEYFKLLVVNPMKILYIA